MVRLWYGIWKTISQLQNSSKEGFISIKLNELLPLPIVIMDLSRQRVLQVFKIQGQPGRLLILLYLYTKTFL
jgi:hypothetical protein